MTHLRQAVSVSAIALALTVGACTSDDTREPPPPESSPEHATTEPLHIADALVIDEGAVNSRISGQTRARIDAGTELLPWSALPRGKAVVGVKHRDPRNPLRLVRNDLAILDPGSHDLQYVSTPTQSEGIQIAGVVATRRWIAWITTPSTTLGDSPWTLYSYDRKTGASYELATAPTLPNGQAPMTSDYSQPSIAGDRVYLTGTSGTPKGDEPTTSVYSAALDGTGGLREDFRGELYPAASGDTVLTARPGPGKKVQLVEHDAGRPGTARVVVEHAGIEDHAHVGDAIAWTQNASTGRTLYLGTGDDDARAVVRAPRRMDALVMTEKYVQFEIGNTAYWYDMGTDKLLRLDRRGVYLPPSASGNYVVWKTSSPNPSKPGGKIFVARLEPG